MKNLKEEARQVYKIYTLSDPRTNKVRYVGVTWLPLSERLGNHCSYKKQVEKYEWVLELKNLGLKPLIEIVEYPDWGDWSERERYWISQFNTWGFDLFNKKQRSQKYRNL